MKIAIPFWDMRKYPRYKDQFEAIGERAELHIIYSVGDEPESHCLKFHKIQAREGPQRILQEMKTAIKIQPDLVYTLSGTSLQASAIGIKHQLKIPAVIRVRGDGRKERRPITTRLQRIYYNILDRETLANADQIIPISQRLRERLLSWGINPKKITYPVPIGVGPQFHHTERPDKQIIGYCGRLNPHKGSGLLIEIIKQMPEHKWIIAGTNEYNYSFPDNVKYLGQLHHRDMMEFYSQIDVLVNPSFTEGFPLSYLEAYRSGVPVVVYTGATSLDIPIIGNRVESRAPTDWRDNILDQLWSWSPRLEERLQNTADQFSWNRYAVEIIEHLERLVYEN